MMAAKALSHCRLEKSKATSTLAHRNQIDEHFGRVTSPSNGGELHLGRLMFMARIRELKVAGLSASLGVLVVVMAATLVLSFGSFRLAGIIAVVAALSGGLEARFALAARISVRIHGYHWDDGSDRCGNQRLDRGVGSAPRRRASSHR